MKITNIIDRADGYIEVHTDGDPDKGERNVFAYPSDRFPNLRSLKKEILRSVDCECRVKKRRLMRNKLRSELAVELAQRNVEPGGSARGAEP